MALFTREYIEKNRHDPAKMRLIYEKIYSQSGLKGVIETAQKYRLSVPCSLILEFMEKKKKRNNSRRQRKKANQRRGWNEEVRREALAAGGRVMSKWENMV